MKWMFNIVDNIFQKTTKPCANATNLVLWIKWYTFILSTDTLRKDLKDLEKMEMRKARLAKILGND